MHVFRLLPLATALAALPVTATWAQSLADLYQSARGYDATYQGAQAQFEANLAKADQGKAGVLPSAALSGGVSRSDFTNDNPSTERYFGTQNASLSVSQPLYRPANWASYRQALKGIDVAQAQLLAAEQDLIVRTAQAYFDVLAAQDSLLFVRAQKAATSEQLASAKRNFEVGTSTITDTREAQARFDLVVAQEIAAENDLRVKRIALDQLVGKTGAQPLALTTPVALPPLAVSDVENWVAQALLSHPNILQAQANLRVAELEVDKAAAGHKPTLDLQASYSVARNLNGSPTTGTLGPNYRTTISSVGLSLNLPLFAGFATQNRLRETLSLQEKARDDLELARRTVALNTRTAYFGVVSGLGTVKALEAAEASSQSALDANKLGYQVGVRINIDVLNSQSQLYQTKRDLAKARYDVLVGGLKLRQANGTLTVDDLLRVHKALNP